MGLRQSVVVQRHQAGALLKSRWDMLHSASATEYFPLTLTLSLGEREQRASDGCLANNCWANSGTLVIARRWTILPLPKGPKGEGRGEGEPSVANPTVQLYRAAMAAGRSVSVFAFRQRMYKMKAVCPFR